jgi:hypothetical protein
MWDLEPTKQFLQVSISVILDELKFKRLNSHIDVENQSCMVYIADENEDCLDDVEKIKLTLLLARAYLQLGAINSKLDNHEESLNCAHFARYYLAVLIFNLQQLIKAHIEVTKQLEIEILLKNEDLLDPVDPYFAPNIHHPNLQKFQKAHSILTQDFMIFCDEIMASHKTFNNTQQNDKGSQLSSVIFWKHNSENNERYLKKELEARGKNMGVNEKLTTLGIKAFCIGSIVLLKPLSLSKLEEKTSFADYFGARFAVEVVLTYSTSLFSIATESRFLAQKRFGLETKVTEAKANIGASKHRIHIYTLLKDQQFVER